MRDYVFVDSNVFIQLLYEGARASRAEELLNRYPLLIASIGVVDEVLHFIVRREAMNKHSVRRAYDLRRLVKSKGIGFAKESLNTFASLLKELCVKIIADANVDVSEIINVMNNYRLSPKDAIVALTCKHYGINTILTFDEDFKRIPWLTAVP